MTSLGVFRLMIARSAFLLTLAATTRRKRKGSLNRTKGFLIVSGTYDCAIESANTVSLAFIPCPLFRKVRSRKRENFRIKKSYQQKKTVVNGTLGRRLCSMICSSYLLSIYLSVPPDDRPNLLDRVGLHVGIAVLIVSNLAILFLQ